MNYTESLISLSDLWNQYWKKTKTLEKVNVNGDYNITNIKSSKNEIRYFKS